MIRRFPIVLAHGMLLLDLQLIFARNSMRHLTSLQHQKNMSQRLAHFKDQTRGMLVLAEGDEQCSLGARLSFRKSDCHIHTGYETLTGAHRKPLPARDQMHHHTTEVT